jgi:hypothetical protein
MPRLDTDSCGSLLLTPAGDSSSRNEAILHSAGSDRPHDSAVTARAAAVKAMHVFGIGMAVSAQHTIGEMTDC